jgi:transcriptional regulator with XRE-family HTH domain
MVIKAYLDPQSPPDGQRGDSRRDPRRTMWLETSGLVLGGESANVTIHNISAAGLLLETALDLAVGEQLSVELPEAGMVAAKIVWRSERLYGCAFEQALSAAALAATQLQSAPANLPIAGARGSTSEPLGKRLNRLRREAGLTLADVAAALSVSKPTVWAWEKGKARPLPERLDAIAAALGATRDELADGPEATGIAGSIIEDSRKRIAEACGTTPSAVRIMIEL